MSQITRIVLKSGCMIGQETNGLGGFANACRKIQIALEIARGIEELCPNVQLLDFANPSRMVTEALQNSAQVNVIGLCNVSVVMQKGITQMLHADEEEVVLQVAGLNHFIWARRIIHEGRNKLQDEALKETIKENIDFMPQFSKQASQCLSEVLWRSIKRRLRD